MRHTFIHTPPGGGGGGGEGLEGVYGKQCHSGGSGAGKSVLITASVHMGESRKARTHARARAAVKGLRPLQPCCVAMTTCHPGCPAPPLMNVWRSVLLMRR